MKQWVKDFWARELRRKEAIANGCAGLVPVCCRTCERPIKTTDYDRSQGEPPILMDFPGYYAPGEWGCTDCFEKERLAEAERQSVA